MADEKKDLVISTICRKDSATSDHTPVTPSRREKVLQSPLTKRIASSVNDVFPGAESLTREKPKEEWRTTFLRFGPLSGVLCMLLSIASLAASFGILAGSNHQPTASWSTSPSTYLAIFTAIANLSVRYAAFQGIVVAWWFKATKGSSLANLHWHWKAGTSLAGALFSGRRMGLVGIACILSTVVVIDGPLLQRASKVVSAANGRPITLDVSMVPEILTGYSGSWATGQEIGWKDFHSAVQFNKTMPTPKGTIANDLSLAPNITAYDVNAWSENLPLRNVIRGCPGRCKGTLRAPALAIVDSSVQSIPVNYSTPLGEDEIQFVNGPPMDHNAFLVVFALDLTGEMEAINLITAFVDIDSQTECTGSLTLKTFTLKSAIGEYDVTVNDGETTLDAPASPRILALANNAPVDRKYNETLQGHPSTLAGIASVPMSSWQGSNVYYKTQGRIQGEWTGGAQYMRYIGSSFSQCPSFADPTNAVLGSLNKMMTYIGASAALSSDLSINDFLDPGLAINYTMIGTHEGLLNEYSTDYWYFVGAAIIEFICLALIAPTYWGWWKIGRGVSFSPLEMAKAFQSPLLADCNSNSSGRSLARETVGREVKYGVQTTDDPELAFGDSTAVVQPTNGMRLGP